MIRLIIIGIYISWQSCTLFCMNTQAINTSSLPPIHCLAFINNSTLIVGTSSKCLTIENLGEQEPRIKVFDDNPPYDFVLNHYRTRLAIKRKKDFSVYDLSTQEKLYQIEAPCTHYSLAISADNIAFVCGKNILTNTQSCESFRLPRTTQGFNITCHPHEKIISYIDTNDTIININHQGELISVYDPTIRPHTNVFYAQTDHIASIDYNPDCSMLKCITQANYILLYNIAEKRSTNYLSQQYATFLTPSIFAYADHQGSVFFLDYKKKDVDQNITHTSSIGSSPASCIPTKKRFDFSPNKLLFALCIDSLCYIKHTPIAVLKDYFISRYFLIKNGCTHYNIPIEVIYLIMHKAIQPHTHHPIG